MYSMYRVIKEIHLIFIHHGRYICKCYDDKIPEIVALRNQWDLRLSVLGTKNPKKYDIKYLTLIYIGYKWVTQYALSHQ